MTTYPADTIYPEGKSGVFEGRHMSATKKMGDKVTHLFRFYVIHYFRYRTVAVAEFGCCSNSSVRMGSMSYQMDLDAHDVPSFPQKRGGDPLLFLGFRILSLAVIDPFIFLFEFLQAAFLCQHPAASFTGIEGVAFGTDTNFDL